MNRKRMAAALLLCLTLLCGCARADWAGEQAEALCARMTALAVERGVCEPVHRQRGGALAGGAHGGQRGCGGKAGRRFMLRDESAMRTMSEWEGWSCRR